ncbi:hypothetical protein HELRODRAFT_193366 [Helobdella robusta]|uniref:Tubulin-specific chaperone E n=1 Tax=Helobdella robusta TaxID=6412 RepID=T1FUX2_HELRO|nr:hypothetical protein HELRODRAFT_193366 [Helobdella robusta]ESN97125.1 hypothetical protein HELRODRAFT_193366 [Helobdella robusta]
MATDSFEINQRIQSIEGDDIGTIKYVGPLPNTTGLWLGIDWDNEERGKHDGTFSGQRFFVTRTSKSGSFLRPTKCATPISLMDAIREKYVVENERVDGESENDEQKKDDGVQSINEIGSKNVYFVGCSKIEREQSSLKDLKSISLRKHAISRCCSANQTLDTLGSLVELSLADNLFTDWSEIQKIVNSLPKLESLNLKGNRFMKGIPEITRHIKILNNSEILAVHKTLMHIPTSGDSVTNSLITNNATDNNTDTNNANTTTASMMNDELDDDGDFNYNNSSTISSGGANCISNINCNNNVNFLCLFGVGFDFEQVLNTSFDFVRLKTLILAYNHIEEIDLNLWLSATGTSLLASPSLPWLPLLFVTNLSLEGNRLRSWSEVLKVGCVLLWLDELNVSACGLDEVGDRTPDAEFLTDHPRYIELIEKFGKPDKGMLEVKTNDIKSELLHVFIALVANDDENKDGTATGEKVAKIVEKKLPPSMTAGRLMMMLVKRIFKEEIRKLGIVSPDPDSFKLSYSSPLFAKNSGENRDKESTLEDKNSVSGDKNSAGAGSLDLFIAPGRELEIPIDDPFKEIGYFSIISGDSLYLRKC